MSEVLKSTSVPVFSIENISTFPLNPYRLFVYHCATTVLDSIKSRISMSLVDFYKLSIEDQKKIIKSGLSVIPGIKVKFEEKTAHKRIFLQAAISRKEEQLCLIQFFTHMTYISGNSSMQEDDSEYVACEINFSEFSGFDFTGISRINNVVDFIKSDTDTGVMDMVFAFIAGLADFTEYVKAYKAKQLMIKNINLFCDKLIKPYVQDIQTAFTPDEFVLGVICGENIHRQSYPYENYLKSVQEFAKDIIDKYGDKYKQEKEEKNNN